MKIDISYTLYTDGDYYLKDSEKFGASRISGECKYVGCATFTNEVIWRCKNETKNFLWKLICEGIQISYTHPWLVDDFYHCIEALVDHINVFDSGDIIATEYITGNYDGTEFTLVMSE